MERKAVSSQSDRPRGRSANIFVNYRREDSAGHAGRLFDALSGQFAGRLFMDIDTLQPGVDFVEAIEQAVGSCEVLIVVIGREWLTVEDAAGHRRLDDPADFVRLELESALARNIRVIPVLVQDAPMPRAEELPPSLARLARRNAIELSDARWAYDVHRLSGTLQDILGEKAATAPEMAARPPAPSTPAAAAKAAGPRVWLLSLAALAVVAAVVLASVLWKQPKPVLPKPMQPKSMRPTPVLPTPVVPKPVLPKPIPEKPHSPPRPPKPQDDVVVVVPKVPSHPKPRPKPLPAKVPQEPSERLTDDLRTVHSISVATLPPPRATITSPTSGETVGPSIQVQGTVLGLGDQRVFLCIRQPDGAIYPRGELFPKPDGQWSIQLRSSKERTFEILVVASSSKEAAQALSDQKSRDDGLRALPAGASISGGAVAVKRKWKPFGLS